MVQRKEMVMRRRKSELCECVTSLLDTIISATALREM